MGTTSYGVSALESWSNTSDIHIGLNDNKIVDNITIAAAQVLLRGAGLAKKTQGTSNPVVTAGTVIGSSANGVLTLASTAYGAGIKEGVYKVVFTEGTVDAQAGVGGHVGGFTVFFPDGTVEGSGKVGTAYNKTIKFTIADGSTNFETGDIFEITADLADQLNQYWLWDTTQTDGREILLGILGEDTDTTNGTLKAWMEIEGKFNKDVCTAGHTILAGVWNNPGSGTIIFAGEI